MEDYKDQYQINKDGTIYSFARGKKKALKQEVVRRKHTNYRRVTLCKNGKTKRFQVHRLVAEEFIPNPEKKPCVNHKDNNGENNNMSNLEWCSHSENMIHAQKQSRLTHAQSSGGVATAKRTRKRLLKKLDELNIVPIKITTEEGRTFITFECSECGKISTSRSDSTLLINGVCRRKCLNTKRKNKND